MKLKLFLIFAILSLSASTFAMQIYEYKIDNLSIPVLLAPHEKAILSSNVVSSVSKILKKMGEHIVRDEPLILLDHTIAAAAVKRTEAIAARAKILFDVKSRLFEEKVSSLVELADATATLEVAAADYDIAKKGLDDTVIKAPYRGEVEELYIHEGEGVIVGTKLMTVFNDELLLAKMLLPYDYLEWTHLNQKVFIHLHDLDISKEAKVSFISESIDPSSDTFKVFAEIDNQDEALKPGMSGVLQAIIPIAVPKLSFQRDH